MKVSMRFSVTSMVLFLLIIVSTLIICFGSFALDKILIAAASNDMSHEGEKACKQIDEYFSPLSIINKNAFELLDNNILQLKNSSKEMMRFLYAININNPNLCGAFWWNSSGDFFYTNKPEERNGIEEILIFGKKHGNKTIQKFYDTNQKLIKVENINKEIFYEKPWYQKAIDKKQKISVIFYFAPLGSQKRQLGIVSAFPLYDKKGVLLGIFGVDMLFNAIYKYINNIKVTKNSIVFVIDSIGGIINNSGSDKNNNDIVDTNIELKKQSFDLYNKNNKDLFIFTYNNKKYISTYKKISSVQTENSWFVAIITPMDDVTKPLRQKILTDLILLIMIIPIGMILVTIFSRSISRPVKKLAQDANLICSLKFDEVKGVFSVIKEISEMNDSFMRMKNAITSFQRYMPVALVKKLIASNNIATVGGENKELTLMFTDIENFTKLSENIEPGKLMQYLSRYFQIVTKIIIDNNGTIDKYIGDGIMAFWGAPIDDKDHALHSCQAALEIQSALKLFNKQNQETGDPVFITRIGINTGNVIVGNVGSDERLNYTSLGDHVNLANRLEGLNKLYKTSNIISEYTYNKVKDNFKLLYLDKVTVKGKQHVVNIYELLGNKECNIDINESQYNQDFIDAFKHYESGDWSAALKLLDNMEKKYPDRQVIKIFIKRCLFFKDNPQKNWNGVWVVNEK